MRIGAVAMRKVTIGLVQMAMTGNQDGNLRRAIGLVGDAAKEGADVVCLPELFVTPYFPQHRKSSVKPSEVPNPVTAALSSAARRHRVVLVGGSVYEKSGKKSFNTSLVFGEGGEALGAYRKVHLPEDPCFYEQDYFDPGVTYRVFDTSHGRIAVLICYDQWYPEAARAVKLMGADIILYPTAIGTLRGVPQSEGSWQRAWENVQRGHAIANSVVVGAANRVGAEGDLRFWGRSFIFNQFGTTLARAGRTEQVIVAECDLDLAREVEEGWGFLRNRRPATYSRLVK
ncbi:MAG TPA: nitrilase-related carbon-nitrogen hydrolase [Nitrososphaerales archaeon]|nr:nitrilase-related carbon-nitrogen hydrolase [Nitrososphaerales archaeon]